MLTAISRPLLLPHNTNGTSGGWQGSPSSCFPRKPHSLCLDILQTASVGRQSRLPASH